MISKDAAHRNVFFKTSEFIAILHVLLAGGLHRWIPWHIIVDRPFLAWELGLPLLIAGSMILRWTRKELDRYSQPHKPGVPTSRLVITGPFHYSRHPTYAAIVALISPGVGILWNNTWAVLLVPLSPIVFYWLLIKEEEEYLHTQFGKEWETFCVQTQQWI